MCCKRRGSTQEGAQEQLGLLMSISHYLLINSAAWSVLIFFWTGVLHKQAIDSAVETIEKEAVTEQRAKSGV